MDLGLIEKEAGVLGWSRAHFNFKTKRTEQAARKFHEQMMQKASEELKRPDDTALQNRLFNGITLSCSRERIELIKDKIDRLQDEILSLVADDVSDSVYQTNVQVFP